MIPSGLIERRVTFLSVKDKQQQLLLQLSDTILSTVSAADDSSERAVRVPPGQHAIALTLSLCLPPTVASTTTTPSAKFLLSRAQHPHLVRLLSSGSPTLIGSPAAHVLQACPSASWVEQRVAAAAALRHPRGQAAHLREPAGAVCHASVLAARAARPACALAAAATAMRSSYSTRTRSSACCSGIRR